VTLISTTSSNIVGEVAFFVKLPADVADVRLADVMPPGASVHDREFIRQAGDNLFFEFATKGGNNIHLSDDTKPSYIEKKVDFHACIRRGETDFQYPDGASTATSGRSVLILVFNGADSARVRPQFQSCLARHGGVLVGSSVFASCELIALLDLSVQLRQVEAATPLEPAARREEQTARLAEQAARIDAEHRALEEQTARRAVEAELAKRLSDLK
jgi:hypothetical protein